jgi:hypothetical protein
MDVLGVLLRLDHELSLVSAFTTNPHGQLMTFSMTAPFLRRNYRLAVLMGTLQED